VPISRELRSLYPPHWPELTISASNTLEDCANVVGGHTLPSSAAYQTNTGSMSKRQRGEIAADEWRDGLT
jgi:hypothetical protein